VLGSTGNPHTPTAGSSHASIAGDPDHGREYPLELVFVTASVKGFAEKEQVRQGGESESQSFLQGCLLTQQIDDPQLPARSPTPPRSGSCLPGLQAISDFCTSKAEDCIRFLSPAEAAFRWWGGGHGVFIHEQRQLETKKGDSALPTACSWLLPKTRFLIQSVRGDFNSVPCSKATRHRVRGQWVLSTPA
jgi:hypothetical protein